MCGYVEPRLVALAYEVRKRRSELCCSIALGDVALLSDPNPRPAEVMLERPECERNRCFEKP